MWKLAVAVGVLGGIVAVADAGKTKPRGFRAAKHYAALFALDREWTYTITDVVAHHDPNAFDDEIVDTSTTTSTTCKVVEARRFANAAMSRITCDPATPLDASDFVARVWIATSKELASTTDPITLDRLPRRDDRSPEIRARPSAHDGYTQEMDEGNLWSEVHKDHGAWCVTDGYQSIGVSGSETICFDARGIRNGEMVDDDESGPIRRITFTRVE